MLSILLGVAERFGARHFLRFFAFFPKDDGIGLPASHAVWLPVIMLLYRFCRRLEGAKARRTD